MYLCLINVNKIVVYTYFGIFVHFNLNALK